MKNRNSVQQGSTEVRVAFVIHTIDTDKEGTQKQLLETIGRLSRSKIKPVLIVLNFSPWLAKNDPGCDVISIDFQGFLSSKLPGAIKRLKETLREYRIDLVHTYFSEATILCFAAKLLMFRPPVLISARRDIGLGIGNSPWYHRLYAIVMPVVNFGYFAIVANSNSVKEHAMRSEWTRASKYLVIPNGIDVAAVETAGIYPDRTTKDDQSASETLQICIVASLTPVKRHDLLIASLARAIERIASQNIKLWIFGDGPLRKNIEMAASEVGLGDNVEFAGAINDVRHRLLQMDIGILCSDREGLSNAILEYMAAGLPTIATAVGGNSELIDSQTGLLVPAGDADELADAIAYLATNRQVRINLGRNARKAAAENYSWDICIGHLEVLYDQAIGSR